MNAAGGSSGRGSSAGDSEPRRAPRAGEPERDPPSRTGDAAQRPAWSTLRAELEGAGFRPSRKLGQNFLLDENLLRAIVRDARVGRGDRVLEVGAGLGFLSLHLARAGVELTSVEIDTRLLPRAMALCAEHPVRWIAGDVLASKHALAAEVHAALPRDAEWHLVANLPYSIAAPLLVVLADLQRDTRPGAPRAPATITALVQREVALRIVARPGSADWGPLSVRLQLAYDAALVRSVGTELFWPRPEVESALVRLERRADPPPAAELDALAGLVQALFQHRRQTLGRGLARVCGRPRAEQVLAELGIEPQVRAEDLELDRLRALAQALARASGG